MAKILANALRAAYRKAEVPLPPKPSRRKYNVEKRNHSQSVIRDYSSVDTGFRDRIKQTRGDIYALNPEDSIYYRLAGNQRITLRYRLGKGEVMSGIWDAYPSTEKHDKVRVRRLRNEDGSPSNDWVI